jgi:Mg-chelatase subunit ChlI
MVTLSDVVVDRDILVAIAALSIELEVDGHRADIVTRKAAQALAAHEDRAAVVIEDVEHVAPMVLAHRVKPGLSGGRRGFGDIADILRSAHDGDGATGP